MKGYSFLILFAALRAQTVSSLKVGDTVCVDGFVMDNFCIQRGFLFDNPTVETLKNPAVHSMKCLIDVESCWNSPYEILLDPKEGEMFYKRGFRLTDSGKKTVIDLALQIGDCGACNFDENWGNGEPVKTGFRIVALATVTDLNQNMNNVPPSIDILQLKPSHDVMNPCWSVYQMNDVQEVIAAEVAAGNTGAVTSIIPPSGGGGGRNKLQKQKLAHGALMMIGWGWLLPSGALIARFFKHRPNALWFKIHRACQIFGLIVALAGWIIALKNFDVFGDKGFNNYKHGVMGMAVMIGGLIQPINALVRPHPPEDGQVKTSSRLAWEFVHKGLGTSTLLLAIATIGLGTTLLPNPDDQKSYQLAYGLGCGGLLLMLLVFMFFDKRACPVDQPPKEFEKTEGNDEDVEEQPAD